MQPRPDLPPLPLPLFRFSLLSNVSHAISTRHGGVSPAPYATLNMGVSTGDLPENVRSNRRAFVESLGLSLEGVVLGKLTHGNDVAVFRRKDIAQRAPGTDGYHPELRGDGVVSDVPGLYFLMTFADCVPLVFADPRRGVVAAAHAGWRGTALGIGPAVVRAMRRHFDTRPEDLIVGIGPSIGPCCYSVGNDVLASFRRHGTATVIARCGGTTYLDLWSTHELELVGAGVRRRLIETPRICTSCNTSTFFSHRAEAGKTGRFALCLGIPS